MEHELGSVYDGCVDRFLELACKDPLIVLPHPGDRQLVGGDWDVAGDLLPTSGATYDLGASGSQVDGLAQAGLPIPASEESSLPVFDSIFVDTGDEQSIEQTLSTFSWHMGNIVRIIDIATHNSLVLLDELGTSTDPEEGAALAQSILLHLLNRKMTVVATTHYNELKVFAHKTAGIRNASLDFDPVTLAPTYHLTIGIPGGSNALSIASKLGLYPEIISEAKEMIGERRDLLLNTRPSQ